MSKLIKTILLFTMVVIFSYNYCYGIDLNLTENTTTNAASQNAQTQANSATAIQTLIQITYSKIHLTVLQIQVLLL